MIQQMQVRLSSELKKACVSNPQKSVNRAYIRSWHCHPPWLTTLPASAHHCPQICTELTQALMPHTTPCIQHSFFFLDDLPLGLSPPCDFLLHAFGLSSGVTSSVKPSLMPLVDSGLPCFPSIHYLIYRKAKITISENTH